jgi:hypothetical protein
MKKYISTIIILLFGITAIQAQTSTIEGSCGDDMKWSFDGYTLSVFTVSKDHFFKPMDNYGMERNISPWRKKKLDIRRVQIGSGVTSIGSCAFAVCENLTEVLFEGTEVNSIGWGAFLNCFRLHTISLPIKLNTIEKIAFANCRSLSSIKIPAKCRVEDQAFASCDNLQSIECSTTAILGQQVFVKEDFVNGKLQHIPYSGEILRIPPYINSNNCHLYGLAKEAVKKAKSEKAMEEDYDEVTSKLDFNIPLSGIARNDTYVLIIGNQNYRFVPDVPYAIHDARVFGDYCKAILGVPTNNIHITENATKYMILDEEINEWLGSMTNREQKRLIVYYAGHGVPDIDNHNKSYLLPTDVRGTSPKNGIALDEFYAKIGDMAFAQTTIFLDACFSGITRDNEGVTETTRSVEIVAEDTPLNEGALVVFSAAQGNETAQGYPEEGHGLFTYYLLKELRESSGIVNFGRLSDNIREGVSEKAKSLKLRKKQTPTTSYSNSLKNTWKDLTL